MSEKLAEKFHDTYERLSVEYGWKTQEQCQVSFSDLPKENRELMIAVVSEVCADLLSDSKRLDKLLTLRGDKVDEFVYLWAAYEWDARKAIDNLEEPHE